MLATGLARPGHHAGQRPPDPARWHAGRGRLADTPLFSRRQSLDASTAAEQARAEALRWQHRLLVDAQMIWNLGSD